MSTEIKAVPRWKTLMGLTKFLENPVGIIDETMAELGDTYITYIGATSKTVMSQDPKIIRHVLQRNHKNYHKSRLQTEHLGKYVGKGLLTINGDYWLQQRRLIQPGFHKQRLKALIGIVTDEILKYRDELRERTSSGPIKVDLADEMSHLTLRIVSKAMFSKGVSDDELAFLGQSVTDMQHAIVKDVRQPIFAWWRKINGESRRAMALAQSTYRLMYQLIDARRAAAVRYDDLLDMMLTAQYDGTDEGMSNEQIKDETLIVFVAGHETTANALTWAMYALDQNPDALEKISTELDALDIERPGFADFRQMGYTDKVINETLRLYPPAWISDRVALEDDEFHGVKLRKGDMIGLYIWGAHRNTKLWDRADQFMPERFDDSSKADVPPFAFFPFGGGPRLCIGQQFAMMEMYLVLYYLLKDFKFSLVQGHPVVPEPLVTLRPKYGMRMTISQR